MVISEYMTANRLVINSDKTHPVVMGTRATAKNRTEVTIQYPGRLAQDQVNKS